ncbi:hypothetical protein [Pseudomonas phage vB_PaeM_PS119XW]|uniref:Uncharacterized protein n=1 Tax=Pseudomonas phage vB_PaeM_PS119XW TaxID=2601632 RepID=A0A5C1K995_9CAUD|nr:hypothetical protein PP933_gp352 [Pseudomonas phage vB_PaeM_PS119XW]QEM42081.1 hypothetical protein [Pseudomonas phage vB_PaeM_PS119XW]
MDYKWHGKFVVEIHGNGCRNGSGTSYLVREGSKKHDQRDYAIISRIGFQDTLLLEEHEVEDYLNNVAPSIAHAIWESEGRPSDNRMNIRALRIDMDSLFNRFQIYSGSPIDMDDSYKAV